MSLVLRSLAGAACAAALLPHAPAQVRDLEAADFIETRVETPLYGVTLALRDLTGDGAQELLHTSSRGILVRRLGPDRRYETTGALFQWPGTTVGWDLADLDGDGRTQLLIVADGRTLQRVPFDKAAGWGTPQTLVESATYLPSGISRVPFTRDIDGDGRHDVVLPGAGRFHLRLNRGADPEAPDRLAWSPPIEVGYQPEIQYGLGDPDRLSATFGQRVRVPWFSMEDVDGDGRQDLVSETDERVAFHLARPEIDALPSWELDLTALKGANASPSDIDLDNLLSIVSGIAQWRTIDLDGKAPNDLIIGSEGTFKIYLGGAATGPIKEPDQVLKASGNVLYFFVRDVIGDPRPDLQIVRGERVSLARVLKYLVVPGQLDFDVFTYQNEGGTFARRPTKRTTLALRVPRLFSFLENFKDLRKELEAQWDIPARRVDWDGDGANDDIVDADGGVLRVYTNCAPPQQRFESLSLERGVDALIERIVLQDLDDLGDGGKSVIDLGAISAFAVSPGKALRDATAGRSPVATFPVWEGVDDREIRARDLDGDGRIDFLTVVDSTSTLQVQLLVRR
ncbi:MAG: hypothetical protein AAF957_21750 [Planctomycetota bacterium]